MQHIRGSCATFKPNFVRCSKEFVAALLVPQSAGSAVNVKLVISLSLLALSACVSTAAHIVTAPVRVAGWTADKLTTSQAEADRNRGRRERKAEKRDAKAAHKAQKAREQADRRLCDDCGPAARDRPPS